jgi:hypothetical protein
MNFLIIFLAFAMKGPGSTSAAVSTQHTMLSYVEKEKSSPGRGCQYTASRPPPQGPLQTLLNWDFIPAQSEFASHHNVQ